LSKIALLVLSLLAVFTSSAIGAHLASGLEFNVVMVIAPVELHGTLQTIISPLNVSDTNILMETNTYVLLQGTPRYSYLFSRNPPLIVILEPSLYNGRYEVWYGGGNPYPSYVGAPGTPSSVWVVHDDFEYPTDFWVKVNTTFSGSRAYVSVGGYMSLTTAYDQRTTHMWMLHGRKALVVRLDEEYDEFVAIKLTQEVFADITQVIDGSDIAFVDGAGACLYYMIIKFTPDQLVVAVNPRNNTTIYMLYGGVNPCPGYRV